MTRSASGHGFGAQRGSGRGRSGRTGASRAKPTAGDPTGSRVTPRSDPNTRTGSSKRTTIVRVAAIAFAVLLVVAMAVGCARFDGDEAAFCERLREVPSFMQLATEVNDGSPDEASAAMYRGAEEFRVLERLAPRSMRASVARLGDSAERIAKQLGPEADSERTISIVNNDGSVTKVPLPESPSSQSQDRLAVFYDEMQLHHGTVSALYELGSYGRDECGITDRDLDLGMLGIGPSAPFDPEPGGFNDPAAGNVWIDPGPAPTVQVAPPETTTP